MEKIVLYNRPMGWFTPRLMTSQAFTEFRFFEPVGSFNNQ